MGWWGEHWKSQMWFDVWSIVHFFFGFCWYVISRAIIRKKLLHIPKNCIDKQKTKYLWISFFSFNTVHVTGELLEVMLVKWVGKISSLFFREDAKSGYRGDSLKNSIMDLTVGILGFWLAYAIFKL